jgi:hypothetical protein
MPKQKLARAARPVFGLGLVSQSRVEMRTMERKLQQS